MTQHRHPLPKLSRSIYELFPEDRKYPFPNSDGSVTVDRIGIGNEHYAVDVELVDGPVVDVGRVGITPGVVRELDEEGLDITATALLLSCHAGGDWGEMPPSDHAENDIAARNGGRILSEYRLARRRIWIISDACKPDGSRTTTILLPSEY